MFKSSDATFLLTLVGLIERSFQVGFVGWAQAAELGGESDVAFCGC